MGMATAEQQRLVSEDHQNEWTRLRTNWSKSKWKTDWQSRYNV